MRRGGFTTERLCLKSGKILNDFEWVHSMRTGTVWNRGIGPMMGGVGPFHWFVEPPKSHDPSFTPGRGIRSIQCQTDDPYGHPAENRRR